MGSILSCMSESEALQSDTVMTDVVHQTAILKSRRASSAMALSGKCSCLRSGRQSTGRSHLSPNLTEICDASCRVQIPIRALPTNDEEDLWNEVQLTHKCVSVD